MKRILLFFSLICCVFLFGQKFSWVKQFKSYTDFEDYISEIEKDESGNIYLLGRTLGYSGIDVDPGSNVNLLMPTNYINSGSHGTTFIIKLDSNGNYLWSYKISNIHHDIEYGLKVKNNKVYALTTKSVAQGNYIKGYLTLTILDLNGNLIKETQLLDSTPHSFDVDNDGNIYLSTHTYSNLTFAQPINSSYNDVNSFSASYLIKFDENLQVAWLKKILDGGESKLILNSKNEIYYAINEIYGSTKYTINRYNSNGVLLWSGVQEDQILSDIIIDKNDNLVISGSWTAQFSPIDVDPSSDQYLLPSNTYKSLYLLWFDTNNSLFDVKKYLNDGQDFPLGNIKLDCDENNNIHINGNFGKRFDANPDSGISELVKGIGHVDGCSITLDHNRVYKTAFRIGSYNIHYPATGSTIYHHVLINNSDYYVGGFHWNCDFDPSPNEYFLNTVNNGQSNTDGFLLKMDTCANLNNLNISTCIGSTIQLNATGGTHYLWTGPNGFSSNLQNPTIPNSSIANAGIYTCQITGSTTGCDGSFSVNVLVEDNEAPIPNLSQLPKITGDCNSVISNFPTAIDNCSGVITATTNDPLQYQFPGKYTIKWLYNDGNGNVATQFQELEILAQALPIVNPLQNFCQSDNPTISNIEVQGNNLKWYDGNGNILSSTTKLVDNTKYYVTQTSGTCESAKAEILVNISDPNAPTGNSNQDFCSEQNPTLQDIVVTGSNIKWYDNLGNSIAPTTNLQNGKTYYATQTINHCESTQKLAVTINVTNNALPANDYSEAFCDNDTDDSKSINLSYYKEKLISNPNSYSFEFYNSMNELISNNVSLVVGLNKFKVKITSTLGCFKWVTLSFTLYPKPKLLLPTEIEFCEGKKAKLDAGSGFTSYLWSTGESSQSIEVDKEGVYNVVVTNIYGCSNSSTIIVKKSNLGEIKSVLIENNNVTVIVSPSQEYLFSLDSIHWQSSNKFHGLTNGNHRVYVKTIGECVLGHKDFAIFSLANSFTPNGDGINDTWEIGGIENYKNSEITILDRYGSIVLKSIINGTFEWNGKSNGRPLPTAIYWYELKISDGRILKGNILLKNRN